MAIILKATPESEKYVLWSFTVDAPIAYGTREDLEARTHLGNMAPNRFERADATGTSLGDGDYGWNSEYRTLIISELGHHTGFYELSLDNLEPFMEAVHAAGMDRDEQQQALETFCEQNNPLLG